MCTYISRERLDTLARMLGAERVEAEFQIGLMAGLVAVQYPDDTYSAIRINASTRRTIVLEDDDDWLMAAITKAPRQTRGLNEALVFTEH